MTWYCKLLDFWICIVCRVIYWMKVSNVLCCSPLPFCVTRLLLLTYIHRTYYVSLNKWYKYKILLLYQAFVVHYQLCCLHWMLTMNHLNNINTRYSLFLLQGPKKNKIFVTVQLVSVTYHFVRFSLYCHRITIHI